MTFGCFSWPYIFGDFLLDFEVQVTYIVRIYINIFCRLFTAGKGVGLSV